MRYAIQRQTPYGFEYVKQTPQTYFMPYDPQTRNLRFPSLDDATNAVRIVSEYFPGTFTVKPVN